MPTCGRNFAPQSHGHEGTRGRGCTRCHGASGAWAQRVSPWGSESPGCAAMAAMVQNWDTPYQALPTTATEKLYQLISPFSGLICFCVSPAAMTQGGEMSYLNLNHERIHYQPLSEGDAWNPPLNRGWTCGSIYPNYLKFPNIGDVGVCLNMRVP